MTLISMADLTHTGTVIDANNTPLAVGYVAAHLKKVMGDDVDVELFKYPEDLAAFLNRKTPTIAAFSNYMWNERLQYEFACQIKTRHPEAITIFGGPNYPIDEEEQLKFLSDHPNIDFYVDGEGEFAFVELVKRLKAVDFQPAALRQGCVEIESVHYINDGQLVRGRAKARIRDLDDNLPSPYLTGLMDKFFDKQLNPLIQTSRGCPYSCTFCHDGIKYMSKTMRFSQDRITKELDYISDRVQVPGLTLADLNWGMFPDDLITATDLADRRVRTKWPSHIASATAKNQKKRIIEMSEVLGKSMHIGASVQSTDPVVLKNIKRTNIAIEAIVEMAKSAELTNTTTFSEIILCLPGDTTEKHFKSVFDLMDAGIQDMRTFQFILLPGTEGASPKERERFEYQTRFRVLPRCYGRYEIYGTDVEIAEIHEVCIGNTTMPIEDYQACRAFDLSLAIFNNGNILDECLALANVMGAKRSELISRIHDIVMHTEGAIASLYKRFKEDEERNFWASEEEISEFLTSRNGFQAYMAGEYGSNQIYKYRTEAVNEHFEELSGIAIKALTELLTDADLCDELMEKYISELHTILLARKTDLTDIETTKRVTSHFDFFRLEASSYLMNPKDVFCEEPLTFEVAHSSEQRESLEKYFQQYGQNNEGLAYFLHRNTARTLYRCVDYAS
ncbi:MAG: B12-binding domain-containing radical SAM protein [Rhodospirillaceae bacterium]